MSNAVFELIPNKIEKRHLMAIGLATLAGAAISAASLKLSKPVPIWVNGKPFHPAAYNSYDNGWPFPFFHYTCLGVHPSCSLYVDWLGLILNVALWAVLVGLGWHFVLKRFTRKRKHGWSRK